MEKIKITGSDQIYEIRSIIPVAEHVLQIIFADDVPEAWGGDIQLYTDGDILATTLTGWTTVYRDEGQTVYLSDDGSVYVPPTDPEPIAPPKPYEPTLTELQASKKQEISQACEQAIYSGVSVTLANGSSEHFALTSTISLIFSASRFSSRPERSSWSITLMASRAGTTALRICRPSSQRPCGMCHTIPPTAMPSICG